MEVKHNVVQLLPDIRMSLIKEAYNVGMAVPANETLDYWAHHITERSNNPNFRGTALQWDSVNHSHNIIAN